MEEEQAVSTEVAEETGAEAPAEETTEQEQTAEATEEAIPQPKKKTAQERISEITKARREAEREAEHWRQIALARERGEQPPEPPRQTPSIYPPRPTLDQFETTVAYEDALFAWNDNKRAIEARVVRQKQEADTALMDFNRRAEKLRAEHEDFDEVVEAEVFSPVMRQALLRTESGPELAYHLGLPENRAEADRIRSLPLELQPYELGKLETRIQLAKQTRKVPGAPAPIKPVGMTGGAGKDPSKMSTAEWMAWDKQRTLDKLKAKQGGP